MPELPEVETVRDGLARWVAGRTVARVKVTHPRSVRRHLAGADDFAARLAGLRIEAASRRGKYLWLPLADPDGSRRECVVAHLGMSGQLLVQPPDSSDEKHLHVRITFADGGRELRFVDQRTFGGMMLDELVPAPDRPIELVPRSIAHIARDPLDPVFDDALWNVRLRRRDSAVKRALLDQSLVSGIGNIYADEALWRAGLHGERRGLTLTRSAVTGLLAEVRDVLTESLGAGGTSFDALYVNVNGQSGYFERSLNVYGREGKPCRRCGTAIRRSAFMNRSSYFCPSCQRPPRVPRNP
ncbi:MAG TPA: bifunctional DNA-formamidopyrimidine glycosylase/DNA-(apurinic or apyrimidinic site) lyase [Jatrophihabitans sp.]|uniref:bifunctional DNA-formamidopyrimidine glycosylase/DNA-(apurinic or apyrimidinic site) lyase n=1 Tax=Jatrophihabitans sp. TaxID=1932789 RepID=UPI002E03F638|nr:bifunctional DNA-formamidopyrimidine glycosylase/DNA-(apurinic or apyrimidinic site) lyase [Jatrophihabitans sp.]